MRWWWRPALVLVSSGVLALTTSACNAIVGFDDLTKVGSFDGGSSGSSGGSNASGLTVAVGGAHTCARTSDRRVTCWGENTRGQLGVGDREARLAPAETLSIIDVETLALGGAHTCATTTAGDVYCWGDNAHGQLGTGDLEARERPARVAGLTARAVHAGLAHTCVETFDDHVRCWGRNDHGQLGLGARGADEVLPREVSPDGLGAVTTLAIGGGDHTCAVTNDAALGEGIVRCWGRNDHGQLGLPMTTDASASPVIVAAVGAASLAYAGLAHSCAATRAGDVLCWGDNQHGQLGDGTRTSRVDPRPVEGLPLAATIGAGFRHTCAFEPSSSIVRCWGANDRGQLGRPIGAPGAERSPSTIAMPSAVVSGAAQADHACAVDIGGDVYCWGSNTSGQLGDGTSTDRFAPVRVAF